MAKKTRKIRKSPRPRKRPKKRPKKKIPRKKKQIKKVIKKKPAKKKIMKKKTPKKKIIKKKRPKKKVPKKKISKKKSIKKRPPKKKISRKRALKKKKPRKKAEITHPIHSPKIRVIGIGGGGGSIINEIASQTKKITFIAANTDLQALKKLSKNVRCFGFGQRLTYGLGTGMNPKLGQIAAETEREKIKKLLAGQDLCVFVSCLGGGTGSGATPLFVKLAKELKVLTFGIFTMPFRFEGSKKTKIAKSSLSHIQTDSNAVVIIPNQKIFQIIDQKTPLKKALSSLNKILAENLKGLIEFIYLPGMINIDFADLRAILEGRGKIAYLHTAKAQGKERVKEAVEKVLNSALYRYGVLGADRILFNIVGGPDLKMTEVEKVSQSIYEFNPRAKIIFGVLQYPNYKNKIKITLLATTPVPKKEPKEKKKPKPKIKPKPKTDLIEEKLELPLEKIKKSVSKKPRKKKIQKKKKLKPIKKKVKIVKKPVVKKPISRKPAEKVKKAPPKIKEPKKKKEIKKPRNQSIKKKAIIKRKPAIKRIKKTKPQIVKKPEIEPKKKIKKEIIRKTTEIPEKPKELPTQSILPPLSMSEEIASIQKQDEKIRKNALDLKRETEQLEKEIEKQERKWDIPAFLRRKR